MKKEKDQSDSLLEKAIFAAIEAGKAILEIYNTDFSVEHKEDNSPLTQADKNAHAIIEERLKDPGIPLLSEEGTHLPYETRKKWDSFWLVDPLDGTKEFVKRNNDFTVNIALIENSIPVLGVIYIPVTEVIYFASERNGAFRMNMNLFRGSGLRELMKQAEPLPFDKGSSKFIVVGSSSHMSAETEAYIQKLKASHPDLEFVSRGSSLKLCLIAEGLADVYPRMGPTMEWDTAAGHALVEISGGTVLRADNGKPLLYNKKSLLNPWFIAKKDSIPGQA